MYLPLSVVAAFILAITGCEMGPAVTGSFDRTLTVSGPIRLELTNVAGNVSITAAADGKVHVHGDVRAYGMGFDDPQKRVEEIDANPPIEQNGGTVKIGDNMSHFHNIGIAYEIEVPHDTEVTSRLVSGSQVITGVAGPVKAEAVSGSIRVEHVEHEVQLHSISGSLEVHDINSDAHLVTASGGVEATNVKGDLRADAISGATQVTKPGGRVDAGTASGSIEIEGATSDVKAHAVSGRVEVQGNPGAATYWDLKSVSGEVLIGAPTNANFRLTAEATSGQIRTDIPVMIEEQSKHSLRAHAGNGGGRIEVHTVSGEIRVTGNHQQ
jgi:DUF4097 and DUF4098 domain-containing protein YvlB